MAGLRILQVLRAPIGGLYRHVIDLSVELVARGHEVGLVMDSRLSDAQTGERLSGLRPHLALGVHKLSMPRLLGPSDLTTPLRLRALARRLRTDILHGHGAKGGFHARLAALGSHRAAIYTPHGGVLHFDPKSPGGRGFLAIERALLRHTDAIVFESAFAARTYSERISAPKCPAPIIHNGLPAGEFEPLQDEAAAHDFAFVGELRALKGVMYLLDALAGLKRPDGTGPSLIMAGDGPARADVETRISELGLTGRVELAGVQPARTVFARGRCIVAPSLAESLPYVVMEAAAARKPVIATNVGGIPEIFGPTAGALVPPADAAALAAAMQDFLDAPETARRQMLQRLSHIETSFSVTRMTDDIEALYHQVLTGR